MRFKKGDRVVVVAPSIVNGNYCKGNAGVVVEAQTFPNEGVWVHFDGRDFNREKHYLPYLYIEEVEFERIINSPLYKALS